MLLSMFAAGVQELAEYREQNRNRTKKGMWNPVCLWWELNLCCLQLNWIAIWVMVQRWLALALRAAVPMLQARADTQAGTGGCTGAHGGTGGEQQGRGGREQGGLGEDEVEVSALLEGGGVLLVSSRALEVGREEDVGGAELEGPGLEPVAD
ncbi:hypothetical protein K438DRAFT_1753810 [Mycena galopus ATCC 62051]|nr:hypothetical protein K438DRAFT_1753810 [Mycena galopus ATCC 62051]